MFINVNNPYGGIASYRIPSDVIAYRIANDKDGASLNMLLAGKSVEVPDGWEPTDSSAMEDSEASEDTYLLTVPLLESFEPAARETREMMLGMAYSDSQLKRHLLEKSNWRIVSDGETKRAVRAGSH